MLLSGFFVLL